MKVIKLKDCAKTEVTMEGAKNAFRQTPIGIKEGSPNVSVRVFSLEPGGHTPHHAHPFEHINYVIEGQGELMSQDEPKPINTGDFMFVAPNEQHQYRNNADKPLVLICIVPKEYE